MMIHFPCSDTSSINLRNFLNKILLTSIYIFNFFFLYSIVPQIFVSISLEGSVRKKKNEALVGSIQKGIGDITRLVNLHPCLEFL